MTTEERGPRSGLEVRVLDVIVVDDDAETLELLRTYLRRHRCSVRIARSVREALDRVRESRPDLLISDLDFGDAVDGAALAEALRNHDRTQYIARIAISGGEVSRELLAMFDAHVRKPLDLDELLELVHEVTGLESPRRRTSSA